ncbi:protein-L-isoaspartate(D-aspartate) O-methyltransferase [Paraburkholderia sp.]|uniref:protein-L-isoaspartate(D-aspartate) O-methyltransferase n=1 Tax=Paraburkholderia sp. TaxID=1926495 RepID=UPI00238A7441|nr:protein-L-isoaspartate(D-aspartate) O-methyltransferase [Paraburkholderia sp.]MDE1184526.1 protein-L-isoaspartate(D-aspartate) O-methyltransferase [Paraburkholderia sp.]
MDDLYRRREQMIDRQIVARGITDTRVIDAMRRVPRERFVARSLLPFAYDDTPLPIEAGQTVSQPYMVAWMLQSASLAASDRVLEIGTGSGYAAAVMASLVAQVDTIERHRELAERARERLADLGCGNVIVHIGDGTLGLPSAAPFDAIISTACGPDVPTAWRAQLARGGRIVMPVGDTDRMQRLIRVMYGEGGEEQRRDLGGVRFVPLIGEEGWPDASQTDVEDGLRSHFGSDFLRRHFRRN